MTPLPESPKIPWYLLFIFLLLSISIIISGYLSYNNVKKSAKQEAQNELSAIADLKVEQITNWRREQIGDARAIYENLLIADEIGQYFNREKTALSKHDIFTYLASLRKYYNYKSIFLLDTKGVPLLSVKEGDEPVGGYAQTLALEAIRTKKVLISDLYRGETVNDIQIDLLAPLPLPEKSDTIIGVLLLRIDARQFLYPLIQSWPRSSRTAETLLVRREGEEVVFLNELRHQKNTALSLRFPITNPKLPAALAVRGQEGTVEGYDYRGIPVLAALRKIPDTRWFLIAKTDKDEIFTPIHKRALLVTVIVVILIIVTGLGITLFWRQQQLESYRNLYKSELQRQALTQHYEYLTRYANDIIFLLDHDLNIVEANERAVVLYGYAQEELLRLNIRDLRPPETRATIVTEVKLIDEKNGYIFETIHQRRDGTTFPVEVSSRVIEVEGKKFYQPIIRDITERKQADESLRKSEERFRIAAESTSDLIWEWNILSARLDWFGQIDELLGYALGEFPRTIEAWGNIIHPEDHGRVMDTLDRHLKRREPYYEEYRVRRKDGTWCFWTDRGTAFWDERGTPYKMVGACTDITERKRSEEAIRESEERFRSLAQTASDVILTMNSDGNIVFWNEGAENIYGYSLDEILGKSYLTLVPERLRNVQQGRTEKAVSNGELHMSDKAVEGIGLRKDGTEFPVELAVSMLQTKEGMFFTAIIRDITERKRAEEALRESEERVRSIVENANDAIYFVDSRGTIRFFNRKAVEIYGYTVEEVLGKPYSVLVPKRLQEIHGKWMDKFLSLDESAISGKIVEGTGERKDGSEFYAETSTALLKQRGETYLVAIIRDITERKKAEEERAKLELQLRQSQKMEAVGHLTGGIAHDFNNILTAIIGYASLLQMKMKEDEPLRSNVEQILGAAARAAALTQSLLAFSRRQIINPKPVNMNEIVNRAEKLLVRIIGEDIELETILAAEDPIIIADDGQIEQVLMNLATNARDAMPDGGLLSIKTELTEIDEQYIKTHSFGKVGDYVLLSVSDTGVGIDEKIRDQIFDPFFTTKEVGKGTGLGLSMAYGIVKQHDGYINWHSEPGKGTTFKIYFPLSRTVPSVDFRETREAVPDVIGGTETILIAEDDAAVRKLTKDILEQSGYTVIEAIDGDDTIKVFMENEEKIRFLILDVIMPKKNGREAYEEIKRINPDMKALFISGYTANVIHKKGILDKSFNFILKPVSPTELLRKVREVLNK